MTLQPCPREPEVLRTVALGWQGAEDRDVARHCEACVRCAEVRAAAEMLRDALARDAQSARVPSAEAMWWRLERRLRLEQIQRAQRITLATQAIVLACTVGVGAAVIQIARPWLSRVGIAALEPFSGFGAALTTVSQALAAWATPVSIIVMAWLVLVPAAVYLGLADD
jgi:hypothetical protein